MEIFFFFGVVSCFFFSKLGSFFIFLWLGFITLCKDIRIDLFL